MKLEIVFEDGSKKTFRCVASFKKINESCAPKVAQRPAEGKLFKINPLKIDRSRFERPRNDLQQELTRKIINKAFAEVDRYPEKYASPFYTLIPERNWEGYKTVEELKQYANDLGGLMADWVEQALEWVNNFQKVKSKHRGYT